MHTTVDRNSAKMSGTSASPLVVQVVRQFLPNRGGLEDVVFNLSRQLIRRGYRVRVVTLDSLFADPSLPLSDRETIEGIEVARIPWKGSTRYPIAPSVLRHIGDADLVHVHAVDFFYDFLALTKLLHRKPMIATTHGGFFHTRRFAAIKSLWFNTLTRFSSRRYRYLVGCSRSDVETFTPISRANLRLIENGADTDKFQDQASPVPTKRIVTIGRFSSNKRLDRLIGMMRALVDREPDWRLEIIGVPSDLSNSDLTRMIGDRGLAGHVRLLTGLSNEEICRVISGASFFASASEYEGFGLVAIEAMSAGLLPVLQENTAYQALAGKHDLISLADFSSPSAAATIMLAAWGRLSADPAQTRATLIAQSEAYSWNSVGDSYVALYNDILG
ncbi:glycosyltransferase family 4 protein [Rhizobium sp. KVB221]|uniref:Glycosyltransferase family 4 protein n=1 Tax=Rhizobium setariae TaxID=2801340 RepID=A0A936YQJ5_9HYPH|nr:glycosyltransferase family 4 protein [Rhizobium setariae]MBL0370530.1 glycosyltransferase family 4 protein [Rhizobium setariae]